jgi:DNA invertase Pin-like site-specific DNA recombinase
MSGSNNHNQNAGQSKPERINRIAIYLQSYSKNPSYINTQENELRKYVESTNQYRRFGEVVEVFNDCGMEFYSLERPGLQSLMRSVQKKQVTLVLVPEFRDLAVLPRELFQILRFFDRHRCGLRSLHDYLLYEDLSDPSESGI